MGEVETETKQCRACQTVKPVTEFYRSTRGMPGYRTYCKACMKAQRRATYQGPDVAYTQVLKRDYDMTLDDYNALLHRQAHRCAACGQPETAKAKGGQVRRLSVDYDRTAGAVRGLLCRRCVLLVWALEDNPATLDAVRAYVDESKTTKGLT